MARPYDPGPKEFVFVAGDGDDRRVSVGDPQEAYMAFSAFFRERDSGIYTIEDMGQKLVLMPGQGVIARIEVADRRRFARLKVDRANRYMPAAMLFFENGYAGLDHFGQWFPDLADLDASPEARGALRAELPALLGGCSPLQERPYGRRRAGTRREVITADPLERLLESLITAPS
ncbi:hypothetical protein GCM10022221_66720 [Actinocorallia aurea]